MSQNASPAAPSAPSAPAAPPVRAAAPAPTPAVPAARRGPALMRLTLVLALAGLAWGAWWALFERGSESTDNAYVQAPLVQVTAQVPGTVVAVLADDTDAVRSGQTLVKLDPADAKLLLDRAEAQLAQTVREVRTLYGNQASAQAVVAQREAEVARLQPDLARAQDDLARRRPLLASGAVGAEEVGHAESAVSALQAQLATAQAALAAAREQAATTRAQTDGTTVDQHPGVARAAAAVREAFLALRRNELPAPVSGQVARRSVQVGQRIAAGAPLMAVVPLDQAWVEANFKEVQLRRMRLGQPVTLHADLYGRDVRYRGHVAGLGAGTGAAFALLPAQNATGNWIKVVQRVPVRIEIEPADLVAHPLRVGLSMVATVDVTSADGAPLAVGAAASGAAAAPPTARASSRTDVFGAAPAEAEARVRQIIAAHLAGGRAAAK